MIISLAAVLTETITLYAFLTNLIRKKEDDPQAIGLGIGASIGLFNVYNWYSEAQKVEECVSMICVLLTKYCKNI